MGQQPRSPKGLLIHRQVGSYPSRLVLQVAAGLPVGLPSAPPALATSGPEVRAREHAIRQVVVLEVAGRLSDVAEELDRAIQLALADGPRGVVCDLSAVPAGAEPGAVEMLASAGRHARDWPGIPVAVACPDPLVREALEAHPLGAHLIVTAALFSAASAVLATPSLAVQRLHLSPHPTAPRASRDFVTRTLLDWRLGRVIPFASLVVGELVASSNAHAGTDLDLSVSWNLGALRLAVRDYGPGRPRLRPPSLGLQGRAFSAVTGLSRAFGVLPTADGGKVVWAVLEALRPRPSISGTRSERAKVTQESPIFIDGRGLAEMPFCAGATLPAGKSMNPKPSGKSNPPKPAKPAGKVLPAETG